MSCGVGIAVSVRGTMRNHRVCPCVPAPLVGHECGCTFWQPPRRGCCCMLLQCAQGGGRPRRLGAHMWSCVVHVCVWLWLWLWLCARAGRVGLLPTETVFLPLVTTWCALVSLTARSGTGFCTFEPCSPIYTCPPRERKQHAHIKKKKKRREHCRGRG